MGFGSQFTQHIQAIDIRQHDVQHHNVTIVGQRQCQSVMAIGGLAHAETLGCQILRQQFPEFVIVFNQQYPVLHIRFSPVARQQSNTAPGHG